MILKLSAEVGTCHIPGGALNLLGAGKFPVCRVGLGSERQATVASGRIMIQNDLRGSVDASDLLTATCDCIS